MVIHIMYRRSLIRPPFLKHRSCKIVNDNTVWISLQCNSTTRKNIVFMWHYFINSNKGYCK
ncbi:unnamed protein product [Spodoptera exigua]|nr:unnamed protein product [Spodoptera exigua]